MGGGVFREKSLERMNSPENLNGFVRVANPGVWLFLFGVIALLAGACIWGVFGRIDRTAAADVYVENGAVICCAEKSRIQVVRPGMMVRFDDGEGVITRIGERDERGYACTVETDGARTDGVYAGEIVIESIWPLSLVLN